MEGKRGMEESKTTHGSSNWGRHEVQYLFGFKGITAPPCSGTSYSIFRTTATILPHSIVAVAPAKQMTFKQQASSHPSAGTYSSSKVAVVGEHSAQDCVHSG